MVKTDKIDRIELRVTQSQKKTLSRAASLSGVSMSSFLLENALSEAEKVIAQSERLSLSDRDRDLFYRVLTNPPAPNEKLRELLKRPKRSVA